MRTLGGSVTPVSRAHDEPDLQARLNARIRREWLASTAIMLALTFCLGYFGQALGVKSLDDTLYDRMASLLVNPPASGDIMIVAIDDASIQEIGQWPWRRARHAALLERLSRARAVALDLVFGEPNPVYPDDDAVLARAIRDHGRVVLPLVIGLGGHGVSLPVPILADAASHFGTINIHPDPDGVLRSISLQNSVNGTRLDHLTLAMLDAGGEHAQARYLRERYGDKSLNMVFSHFTGNGAVVPFNRVLDGSIPASAFRDKYVLVGAWASGLGDAFATPYSSKRGNMPGVEVLANILNNGLSDTWIKTPGTWPLALLALLPVLICMAAFRYLSPQRAFAFSLFVAGIILLVTGLCLHLGLWWLSPSAALIGTVLAYPVWSWRSQHAALRHIDKELALLRQEHPESTAAAGAGGDPHGALQPMREQTLLARIRQLHDAISAARQAQRQRNETLRFLSHDMRAPLNSILALTDLQRAKNHPEQLDPDTLAQFDHYATKTLELVDGFVALSRAEAIELQMVPVDLSELIRQACDGAWARARKKDIRIDCEDMHDDAWIRADTGLLERAWANLLDNALKYSDPGTRVTCSVKRDGDDWVASIQDQGYGMDDAGLQTAFSPFVRVDEDRPDNPSGAGLGLAFVQIAVARNGGSITADSAPGAGTRFTIRLPAIVPPARHDV